MKKIKFLFAILCAVGLSIMTSQATEFWTSRWAPEPLEVRIVGSETLPVILNHGEVMQMQFDFEAPHLIHNGDIIIHFRYFGLWFPFETYDLKNHLIQSSAPLLPGDIATVELLIPITPTGFPSIPFMEVEVMVVDTESHFVTGFLFSATVN